ncbi:hypothetical protein JCM10207_005019 [Rhodosporidiobolus poonsookiae]
MSSSREGSPASSREATPPSSPEEEAPPVLFKGLYFLVHGANAGWTAGKIRRFIVERGGKIVEDYTSAKLTHAVVGGTVWGKQTTGAPDIIITQIRKANDDNRTKDNEDYNRVWLLPLDWIIDSDKERKKLKERKYDLERTQDEVRRKRAEELADERAEFGTVFGRGERQRVEKAARLKKERKEQERLEREGALGTADAFSGLPAATPSLAGPSTGFPNAGPPPAVEKAARSATFPTATPPAARTLGGGPVKATIEPPKSPDSKERKANADAFEARLAQKKKEKKPSLVASTGKPKTAEKGNLTSGGPQTRYSQSPPSGHSKAMSTSNGFSKPKSKEDAKPPSKKGKVTLIKPQKRASTGSGGMFGSTRRPSPKPVDTSSSSASRSSVATTMRLESSSPAVTDTGKGKDKDKTTITLVLSDSSDDDLPLATLTKGKKKPDQKEALKGLKFGKRDGAAVDTNGKGKGKKRALEVASDDSSLSSLSEALDEPAPKKMKKKYARIVQSSDEE